MLVQRDMDSAAPATAEGAGAEVGADAVVEGANGASGAAAYAWGKNTYGQVDPQPHPLSIPSFHGVSTGGCPSRNLPPPLQLAQQMQLSQ